MTKLFQHRYYKINKCFLSIFGLWPYQSQERKRTLLAIFVFSMASQMIPQIIAVVEFWDDPDIVLESIPPFVIDAACGIKLLNMILNTEKMLKLVQRMEFDWMSLIHQPEIHVLEDYAETGRQFTIAYAVGIYTVTMLFMTQPIVQWILTPNLTDETQTKEFPFPVDYYGIDFETYYYYMLTHSCICVGAIVTVIIATDTMFIVYVQHACGMFTVVGCQMKQMGEAVPDDHDLCSEPSRDPGFQQLAACIKKHSEVIEYADLLEASYTRSFFIIVGLNMMVMSITGFQAVTRMDDSPQDAIRYAAFTLSQMAHLFFQCFFSQRLKDHSEQVADYMYQAEWYKTSLCSQKLLNLVTMRTYVSCQLTAGNIILMSLENFTSIVKTSVSYCTLLRSMQ